MRPLRFNLAQRIVTVVTLASILWLVGSYLTSPVPFTGWVGYAPLASAAFRPATLVVARDGLAPVANLFVWFGLVLAWSAGALFVFSGTRRRPHQDPDAPAGATVDAGSPATGD